MATGIPASHTELFAAAPSAQLLDAFAAAAHALGWTVGRFADRVMASTKVSLWSFGEQIEVRLVPEGAAVTSRCALPTQVVDWGKNAKNVRALVGHVRLSAFAPSPAGASPPGTAAAGPPALPAAAGGPPPLR